MSNLKLKIDKTFDFVSEESVFQYKEQINESLKSLYEKTGKGNDFLGWVNLPSSITNDEIADIQATAESLRKISDYIVVVGIGGSYLGAKCVIEALSDTFSSYSENGPKVLYAGQNIGEDYTYELVNFLKDKSFSVVSISKSGTTTEPAIAFRILKNQLEEKYSQEEVKERIVAITDAKKGALRVLADQEGYKTFVIPDDVGGRFSVLTPVGLLPIACAGFDITKLVEGAVDMEKATSPEVEFEKNPASIYAAVRNSLYSNGKEIEMLVNYNHKLMFFAEWWKQLYGESEGKELKGIFPASANFTTDLHSLGQYVQDGERHIFETVISVASPNNKFEIPSNEANLDGLNYIAGKGIDEVNKMAELGTLLAHIDGGVPNIQIEIPALNEYYIGQLIYFFEIGCGISGYVLDVNPFDQPGVEAYKKNMFALLEKPGFEKETEEIKKRL